MPPAWRRALVVGSDAAALLLASGLTALSGGPDSQAIACLTVLTLPMWLLALGAYGLYSRRVVGLVSRELLRLVHAVAFALALQAIAASWLDRAPAVRTLVFHAVVVVAALGGERIARRLVSKHLWRRGILWRRTAVVGGNADAVALATAMLDGTASGDLLVGVFAPDQPTGTRLAAGIEVAGDLIDLSVCLRDQAIDVVVIVTSAFSSAQLAWLVRRLGVEGVQVELTSSLPALRSGRLSVNTLGTQPVLCIDPCRPNGVRPAVKRAFDVVVATGVITAGLPLWVAIAVAIKLDSPGPIFFRQVRVGHKGRSFSMLKFRTMVVGADRLLLDLTDQATSDGPLFKIERDPRVTRVGRVLRRYSLDEIPQLWDVIWGRMSLIGPRPALQHEVDQWSLELYDRLRVKPGITGMWQVSGRSDLPFDEYVRLDLYYVDNWSLTLDMGILARTLSAVVTARGAY